jgi:TolB-like protein/class 3 adenylate cyclase/Flp pilus assembly protein TadD
MSTEVKKEGTLEIAHVLFIDIVGYSKLPIDEQHRLLGVLNQIVRGSEEFRKAEESGRFLKIPTGDGMALVFYDSPETPVECALQVARGDRQHPELSLRMGIHSGPVRAIMDVNERANVAGAGINMAQRIMDCGDAGHILLSKRVAEDLEQYQHWQPCLHELGECEVKHDVRVSVFNLYTDDLGNPNPPAKFTRRGSRKSRKGRGPQLLPSLGLGAGAAAILILGFVFFWLQSIREPRPRFPLDSIPEKSIAVLPFENLSDNKENAYFADGVQDAILTELSKIADLKVISRTSVMQYKTKVTRNLGEIGRQLGVAHLLEGSVQHAEGKVRVNAQLVDARTDGQLWAAKYDRPLTDVFAIQSEIAKAIAEQLQAKLSPQEKAALSHPPTTDLAANKLYVEAKALEGTAFDPNAKDNLLRAAQLLNEAVMRDPRFSLAYCLLGMVHLDLYFQGFDHSSARRDLANAAIQNAVRLEPDSGEVHLALARYAYHGFRDYERARKELDLARRTLPNNADVYFLTAAIERRQGRWDQAVQNFEQAVALDPRNFLFLQTAGRTYSGLHRYAESTRLFQRALELQPNSYFIRLQLALNPFCKRADAAPWRAQLSMILAEDPDAGPKIVDGLLWCALIERNADAARRALAIIPPEGLPDSLNNSLSPREWFVGFVARAFGDAAGAHDAFTTARVLEEKIVREQPDYAPAWSLLGLIDAGLGNKADAIREGQRACELLSPSKDSWDGPVFVNNLAVIYAWVGEKDLAFKELDRALQLRTGINYGDLKCNPQWDPLRSDPRFAKVLAALAPK